MQTSGNPPFQGNRLGALVTEHTWRFASGFITSGSNSKLCTLKATAASPVLYTTRIIEASANTASGAVTASIGTASAGTQLLNAVDLKAAAGTNYTSTNVWNYSETDVELWLNYTVASGTDAAGKFIVKIDAFTVNTSPYANNEL